MDCIPQENAAPYIQWIYASVLMINKDLNVNY